MLQSVPAQPHQPTPSPLRWDDPPPSEVDLLVVGGGFAGLMTAVHVRAALPQARIAVVEREPRWAPGVAYGACHPTHLLNVPAGRMGVDPGAPGEFLEWCRRAGRDSVQSHEFVPRATFGQYLNAIFQSRLGTHLGPTSLVRSAVVRVAPRPDGWVEAILAGGQRIHARAALLALGLPAAAAPWEGRTEDVRPGALVPDPWAPGALDADGAGVRAGDGGGDGDVLVLGSGLTAIDAVLALRRHGHRGRVTLLSRHGRLPCPHAGPGDPPFAFDRPLVGLGVAEILRLVRRAVRRRAASGLGWQAVIDAIRPQITDIWRSWSDAERSRFLARVRPHWEVHRHRAPIEVLSELDALRSEGALEVLRGELLLASGLPDGRIVVSFAERRGAVRRTGQLIVERLINCAGPAMDLARSGDPLLRSLLAEGVAAVDSHGLGLRADPVGRVLPGAHPSDRAGPARPAIFLAGALRRGDLWESTAIPELRVQAVEVAREIVRTIEAADGRVGGGPHAAAAATGRADPTPPPPAPAPRPLPRRDATASPPEALRPLFARLASFDGPIPYPDLMRLLEDHPVTAPELGDAIQIDGAAYVRTLVFHNQHVELLVMAWLPGQCSPIHDHAGSGCAVRVVAGTARERLYEKRDEDGLVDFGGERMLRPGEVTGALDEEIHSLGNAVGSPAPPSSILVTLHAYSPPLKPTRKYEARPAGAPAALVVG